MLGKRPSKNSKKGKKADKGLIKTGAATRKCGFARELIWCQTKIDQLTHELSLHKRWRFGVKTERLPVEQAQLFEETVKADPASMTEELDYTPGIGGHQRQLGYTRCTAQRFGGDGWCIAHCRVSPQRFITLSVLSRSGISLVLLIRRGFQDTKAKRQPSGEICPC